MWTLLLSLEAAGWFRGELHACAARFDVMENLENFLVFGKPNKTLIKKNFENLAKVRALLKESLV
jgi:hypothetical protein